MVARRTMTLNLTEAEMAVLEALSEKKELSKTALLRQALRMYQVIDVRLERGDKLIFEERQDEGKIGSHDAMTSYPIQLLDVAAGSIVEAELHDDIAEKQLIDWQFQWRPAMQTYLKRLAENGISPKDTAWPQSWHWDWRDKINEIRDLLGHTGYSVVCRDVTQGMMRLDLVSKQARHQTQRGKPLVYVDYLEVAPWNWREEYADPPIYRLVGSVLTHAAFTRSVNEGFKGSRWLTFPAASGTVLRALRLHQFRYASG